jgi:ubiquinone/menaquinone biosynthesis C-methylase UbiE
MTLMITMITLFLAGVLVSGIAVWFIASSHQQKIYAKEMADIQSAHSKEITDLRLAHSAQVAEIEKRASDAETQVRQLRFKHWVDLPDDDIRSVLFALIGNDFGAEPEKRILEIRESRKEFANYFADKCEVDKEDNIIDLGSGCGFGTYWLSQRAKHVYACDISPAYITIASKECSSLSNVSFHLMKSKHFDFLEKDSIDAVCSMSVFIHFNLYDIYWYFSEFRRVVKPGGRICFDVADSESLDLNSPNRNGKLFLSHANAYEEQEWMLAGLIQWNSLDSIIRIADHFGFQNKCKESGGVLLFIKHSGVEADELPSLQADPSLIS